VQYRWRARRALAFTWRLQVKGAIVNTVCWCKFTITLFPPLAFLQNDHSQSISLSSESTRDTNLCGDDESVAMVGIELSPTDGGGISRLSSSNSFSSKRPRIDRLRGSLFIPPHMQQCHRPWYWREIYPDYGASS